MYLGINIYEICACIFVYDIYNKIYYITNNKTSL